MNAIEEVFNEQNILEWIKDQQVSFYELCSIYSKLTGVTKDEAEVLILTLVEMVRLLLKNRHTVTLGKRGQSLGSFYFFQFNPKTRTREMITEDGDIVEIERLHRAYPKFRVSKNIKEEAMFVFCDHCRDENLKRGLDQVVDIVPYNRYKWHLRHAHGIVNEEPTGRRIFNHSSFGGKKRKRLLKKNVPLFVKK